MQLKFIVFFKYLFYVALLIALALSLIAFSKYPGKTIENSSFDFSTDYWCDLYKRETPSGKINGGMLFAKLATISAFIAFSSFWIVAALKYGVSGIQRLTIIGCGISAIACGLLLFSKWHNTGIIVGSILGSIAILSLMVALKHHEARRMFYLGILVILLLVACNTFLYLPIVDQWLPVLQKILCGVIIIWTLSITKGLTPLQK